MLTLCSHENIPWIYGIVTAKSKILVMSLHNIDGTACSLHRYIHTQHRDGIPDISSPRSKTILSGVVSAIGYIHSKQILHNDIKCDNVILESSPLGLKGILIDFGKACLVSDAKQYKLSNEDKLKYINDHPQIAPDLRDGKCKQSIQSDIYSFGRILRIVNDASLHLAFLTSLSSMCMEYVGSKRPTSDELCTSLSFLLS
jgi:serine/threonine protein kinase